MQLTEAMLGVGLLLAVVNLGGVSAMSASRYPSMPSFLSDSMSGRSWEECSGENEACYTDGECCGELQCLLSKNVRGPRYSCRDVPSRSYRHLVAKPGDVEEGARVNILSLEGEECKRTADCSEGLCCKKMFIFRKGLVQKCGEPSYFSECL